MSRNLLARVTRGLCRSAMTLGVVVPLLGPVAPVVSHEGPTLVIATEGANPPFNFIEPDSTLGGFEVDFGKALCHQMGENCRFVAADWASLIPGLLTHRFDAVMAMVETTAERRKLVAFSDKYADLPAALAVPRSSPLAGAAAPALAGRRIGAQAGTVFADYLRAHAADAAVRLYATLGEAEIDLADGRIDAVLANKAALMAWMAGHDGACCVFSGADLRDPAVLGTGIGVALRPEDRDLRERINHALATVIASGTYDLIDRRYFPFSIY